MLSMSHQRYVATLCHMLSIVIDPIRLPRSLGLFTPTYAVAISVRFQKDGFTIIFNVIVGVIGLIAKTPLQSRVRLATL